MTSKVQGAEFDSCFYPIANFDAQHQTTRELLTVKYDVGDLENLSGRWCLVIGDFH